MAIKTVSDDSVYGIDSIYILNNTADAETSLYYAQSLVGDRRDHPIKRFSPYTSYVQVKENDFGIVFGNVPVLSYEMLETEDNKDIPYHVKPRYVGETEPGHSNMNWSLKNPTTPELFDDQAYEIMPDIIENNSFMVWLSAGSPFYWLTVKDSLFAVDSMIGLTYSIYSEVVGEDSVIIRDRCYLEFVPNDQIVVLNMSNAVAACRDNNGKIYTISTSTINRIDLNSGDTADASFDTIGRAQGIMAKPDGTFFYMSNDSGKIHKFSVESDGSIKKRNEYFSVSSDNDTDLVNIHRDTNGTFYYEIGNHISLGRSVKSGFKMLTKWDLSTTKRKGMAYFYCEFEEYYYGNDPQLNDLEGQRQIIDLRDVYTDRFEHRLSDCDTLYTWYMKTTFNGNYKTLEIIAEFNLSNFSKAVEDRDFVFGSMVRKLGWKEIEITNYQAPYFTDRMQETIDIGVNFDLANTSNMVALAFNNDGSIYYEIQSNGRILRYIPLKNWYVWPAYHDFSYYFGVEGLVDGYYDNNYLWLFDEENAYQIPVDLLNCYMIWDNKVKVNDEGTAEVTDLTNYGKLVIVSDQGTIQTSLNTGLVVISDYGMGWTASHVVSMDL